MFPAESAAPSDARSSGPAPARRAAERGHSTYGWPFWLTYIANTSMMVAISLLFRYADFVTFLGGSELILGLIVGFGMVGSLLMRLAQGVGIDTYGPRKIWLGSTILFVITCVAHLGVSSAHGPAIFLLRIAFQCAIAGFFGASLTYISARAPLPRVAEVVGSLGTSGFVGMVLGTWLGDRLVGQAAVDWPMMQQMFLIAAGLGVVGSVFSWLATREPATTRLKRRQPSVIWLLRRYHPGPVLLVSAVTGFGTGLPSVFVRPFAADQEIAGIAIFFAVYSPMAFAARLSTRKLPERLGLRRMLLLGMTSLIVGMLMFTVVRSAWMLALPAIFTGIAHAILFPSIVAAGSRSFPLRYRGLATTLVLAVFDFGTLVGAPLVGIMLYSARMLGLPAFPAMFTGVAVLVACTSGIYFWMTRSDGKVATAEALPRVNAAPRKRRRRVKVGA